MRLPEFLWRTPTSGKAHSIAAPRLHLRFKPKEKNRPRQLGSRSLIGAAWREAIRIRPARSAISTFEAHDVAAACAGAAMIWAFGTRLK